MASKYLYGAAVHSIQPFIFETGKLKEIVGASEFVEQVCGTFFKENVPNYAPNQQILSAAGKIIYRFDNLADCQQVVRTFPKFIKEKAPNIQFSQAVVKIEAAGTKTDLDALEKLLDAQRNRPTPQHGLALMITERARRTGQAGFEKDLNATDKKALVDRTQYAKIEAFEKKILEKKITPEGKKLTFADKLEDIAKEKEWLAIIHADGNSLGKSIQKILSHPDLPNPVNFYRDFSKELNNATEKAAQLALIDIVLSKVDKKQTIPLRPVLLGGDDLTIIIRGDLALDFTASYLRHFEKQTKAHFGKLSFPPTLAYLKEGLTACAGIAYIKPNYPFHYGAKLSEELTAKFAKATAKNIARQLEATRENPAIPSCIAFHKIQSSFIGDYASITERELYAKKSDVYFNNGPYFIHPQTGFNTVADLQKWVTVLQKADAPKSNLREWLTELQISPASAQHFLERINDLHPRFRHTLKLGVAQIIQKRENLSFTHIYDALTIESIATKKQNEHAV